MSKIESILSNLELQAHPEGGFYKEVYRSEGVIPQASLEGYSGDRNHCTSIYFMLTEDSFSAFHRIKQDEIWHFYDGDPISIHVIDPEGNYSCTQVGNNFEAGEVPQFVVRGGSWFASEVESGKEYSLVGCTVAPGFDFEDFELPPSSELIAQFPQHEQIIRRLTRH